MRFCPRTILAVEDSADEIFFLQRAFDELGYGPRVYFARDGTEAMEYISGIGVYGDRARYPLPCVVMTDLKMPVMDGFQLIKWLRQKSSCKEIPVFVLTSSQLASDTVKAESCGANGYFQKPAAGGSLPAVLKEMESNWLPHLSACNGNAPRRCEGFHQEN